VDIEIPSKLENIVEIVHKEYFEILHTSTCVYMMIQKL